MTDIMPYLETMAFIILDAILFGILNKKAKCFTTSLNICFAYLILIDHHKNKWITVDLLVQVGF
jgi:hypothetical protein